MNGNFPRKFLCFVLIQAVLLTLLSCGGAQKTHVNQSLSQFPNPDISKALMELDELLPPKDVDASLFQTIKDELKNQLLELGKSKVTSTPPSGDANKVTLTVLSQDGMSVTLGWEYRNIGDYNQDGVVDIQDVRPLALHFQHRNADNLDEVIDGNRDNVVDLRDIQPMALNFFVRCAGYHVEGATETGEFSPTPIEMVDFNLAQGKDQGWASFEFTISDIGENRRFRVVPVDANHTRGIESDPVIISTAPPQVTSVTPTEGFRNQQYTFRANVSGTEPFTNWSWTFNDPVRGEWATADDPNAERPRVTLTGNAGDDYEGTVHVENMFGSTDFTFYVDIRIQGNPPNIVSISPPGGARGKFVTFNAVVEGDEPLQFSWDFDGAVVPPSTTTARSPSVTLTDTVGTYQGTLTVTNPDLMASDTETFTINVTSGTNPPTVTLTVVWTNVTAVANDPDYDKLSFAFNISPIASPVRINPSNVPFTYQWTQNATLRNLSLSVSPAQLNCIVTDDSPLSLSASDSEFVNLQGATAPVNNSVWMVYDKDQVKVGEDLEIMVFVWNLNQKFNNVAGLFIDFTDHFQVNLMQTLNMGAIGGAADEADGLWAAFGTATVGISPSMYDQLDWDDLTYYVNGQPSLGSQAIWMNDPALNTGKVDVNLSPPVSGEIFNFKLRAVSPGTARIRFVNALSWTQGGQPEKVSFYRDYPAPPPAPPADHDFATPMQDFTIEVVP